MSDVKFDINELRQWQQEGNRSVIIELGEWNNKEYVRVFCYDYDIDAGQSLNESVSELNLIDEAIVQKEKELERLKAFKEAI